MYHMSAAEAIRTNPSVWLVATASQFLLRISYLAAAYPLTELQLAEHPAHTIMQLVLTDMPVKQQGQKAMQTCLKSQPQISSSSSAPSMTHRDWTTSI